MKSPKNRYRRNRGFSMVPSVSAPRSTFKLDQGHKLTFDAGYLMPFYMLEVLPGDSIKSQTGIVARLATPLKPIMDNIYLDTHFFFVPNRILWDNWERFNGAQDNPGDSTDYLTPVVTPPSGGFARDSIYDILNIPPEIDNLTPLAFPFRAYNLIWNEWFRSQDLQDSVIVNKDDGPDLDTDYTLLRRGKRHDYFTSCLPSAQKGDPVSIGIGGLVDVTSNNQDILLKSSAGVEKEVRIAATGSPGALYLPSWGDSIERTTRFGDETGLQVDLAAASAVTISQLRLAFQTQRYLERNQRSGTRYVEYLKAHFGVTSPDFRFQRPEYLGGGSQYLNFYSVSANTTSPDESLGELAAFGLSTGSNHGFSKSFTEHGVIIGLLSARADLTYQRGLPRYYSRRSLLDFAIPVFAHLSEQAVLNKEIYAQGTADDDLVFGYQERYAEYRTGINIISGRFRSDHSVSLDVWHLSQDFASLPTLSSDFIEDDPPIDRVVAVPSEPHFIADTTSFIRATRVLPVRGVPGLIDHF